MKKSRVRIGGMVRGALMGCLVTGGLAPLLAGCASEGETLTYCTVEPIFADKCVRCHSDPPENGAPFPLTTFEDVDSNISRVEDVIESGFMPLTSLELDPPVEDLTEEERDLLLEWIDLGAPAGSCE